jgi:predicted lactoylglutathione lyase
VEYEKQEFYISPEEDKEIFTILHGKTTQELQHLIKSARRFGTTRSDAIKEMASEVIYDREFQMARRTAKVFMTFLSG